MTQEQPIQVFRGKQALIRLNIGEKITHRASPTQEEKGIKGRTFLYQGPSRKNETLGAQFLTREDYRLICSFFIPSDRIVLYESPRRIEFEHVGEDNLKQYTPWNDEFDIFSEILRRRDL